MGCGHRNHCIGRPGGDCRRADRQAAIVKLNGTLNKLSGKLELLLNNLEEFKGRYMQNLTELKEADRKMDERLINHETRISKLEADHHTEG